MTRPWCIAIGRSRGRDNGENIGSDGRARQPGRFLPTSGTSPRFASDQNVNLRSFYQAIAGAGAFDADWLRNDLLNRGVIPVIPLKSSRKFPAEFDRETYKWRHLIENYFGKIKENRGIAIRSCKTDQSFKAFISIAETTIQMM